MNLRKFILFLNKKLPLSKLSINEYRELDDSSNYRGTNVALFVLKTER